ncbi:hypothetical protein AB1Y20_006701 [Prymnesium parvum]|uniref:Uncharacterized protein n=1 Tax=Prymnesium parvum TaxID=97485 RepID=A0AB34IZ18_PRYPA
MAFSRKVMLLAMGLFTLLSMAHVWMARGLLSVAYATLIPSTRSTSEELPLFVMSTFVDGRTYGEGVHILTSHDARAWRPLDGDPNVYPQGRAGTVVRDPSIIWHEGYFHIVYTTELCAGLETMSFSCDWKHKDLLSTPARFGYARSRDLVHWFDTRFIEVPLDGACNVWAPEWHKLTPSEVAERDGDALMVVFSSTVPPSSNTMDCPPDFGPNAGANLHRPYFMTTSDFERYSSPKLLFDMGESIIDTFLFRSGDQTYAIYKSEQNRCRMWGWSALLGERQDLDPSTSCTLALRLAVARSAFGPYTASPVRQTPIWNQVISRQCAEGPSVLQLSDESSAYTLVLYDGYRPDCPLWIDQAPPCPTMPGNVLDQKETASNSRCSYRGKFAYGAIATRNLLDWTDVSEEITGLERGGSPTNRHKHGTAIRLELDSLCSICEEAEQTNTQGLWRGSGVLEHCHACR